MSNEELEIMPIEPEEVLNIRIRLKPKTLNRLIKFLIKIAPHLGVTFDEIKEFMSVTEGEFSKEQKEKALAFKALSPEQKELVPENDRSFHELVLTNIEALTKKINNIPVKLLSFFNENCFDENENVLPIFDEFLSILELATGQSKLRLLETNVTELVELSIRLFTSSQSKAREAFFIMKVVRWIVKLLPSFNFMRKEKLNTESELITSIQEE